MTQIEQIKTEIERLKEMYLVYQDKFKVDDTDLSVFYEGKTKMCGEILSFIESLEQEPYLPSNVDEAAEEYARENATFCYGDSFDGFKAGAEWRDAQILKPSENLEEFEEDRFDDVFYKFLDKKDKEVISWSEDDLLELAKYLFDFGKKVGAKWQREQHKSIPEEYVTMDFESARNSVSDAIYNHNKKNNTPIDRIDLDDVFYLGAKWMTEQGITYEDTISAHKTFPVLCEKEVSEFGLDYGDRVIVQIRKK